MRRTIVLTGEQGVGKTTLARLIDSISFEECVIMDAMSEREVIELANKDHRIPYSTDVYELVIICTTVPFEKDDRRLKALFPNTLIFKLS